MLHIYIPFEWPFSVKLTRSKADTTVCGHLGLQASDLAGGELVHASIISVVHEVVDGVNTTARAGIAVAGASESSRRLRGGIRDGVTGCRAAALEGVEQADPVTSFMSQSLTQVVGRCSPSRRRGVKHNNTIILCSTGVAGREGGVAKEASTSTRDEADCVYVEVSSTTLSERVLHCGLLRGAWPSVVEPVGVGGTGGTSKNPSDSRPGICSVHNGDLVSELGSGNVAAGEGGVLLDDMEVDVQSGLGRDGARGDFLRHEVCLHSRELSIADFAAASPPGDVVGCGQHRRDGEESSDSERAEHLYQKA